MKKNRFLSTILTVVMVIECVLIIITLGVFWSEFSYEYSWYPDEEDMVYTLQDGQYGRLVENYYSNEYSGRRVTHGMRECFGVAKYFEAALWYNAYEIAGDAEKYAIYAEKMEEAYEEMGDYQFLDSDIREKLNMD